MSSPILDDENSLRMPKDEIQFIIDLKFQSNNLCENVHDVSLEDNVEDDETIDLSKIFKEEVQPTHNLSIKPSRVIEIARQNQIEETLATLTRLCLSTLKIRKLFMKNI